MAQPSPPSTYMGFEPKPTMPVTVGKMTVNLYPRLTADHLVSKRAHAFYVNKSALEQLPMEPHLLLNAMGNQLSLGTTIDGHKDDWICFFYASWSDPAKLRVISFHNSAGTIINNCVNEGAANPMTLKDIADGSVNDCHPPDVTFIFLEYNDDYVALAPNQPGTIPICFKYYLELPQTTHQVNNANGQACELTTYAGPSYFGGMSAEDVQTVILDVVLQDTSVDLKPPAFGQQDATNIKSSKELHPPS